MTKRDPLTLDEHHRLSQILANIKYDLMRYTGVYKKNSSTNSKVRNARSTLQRLIVRLEDLVLKDHPANRRFVYTGGGQSEDRSFDALYECFYNAVFKTINGRVPVQIMDQALKCERVLYGLKIAEHDNNVEKDKYQVEIKNTPARGRGESVP